MDAHFHKMDGIPLSFKFFLPGCKLGFSHWRKIATEKRSRLSCGDYPFRSKRCVNLRYNNFYRTSDVVGYFLGEKGISFMTVYEISREGICLSTRDSSFLTNFIHPWQHPFVFKKYPSKIRKKSFSEKMSYTFSNQ